MGCFRCLKRSDAFQVDRLKAKAIEEANALTQQHMGNGHMEFIEQTRLFGYLRFTPRLLKSEAHPSGCECVLSCVL